MYTQCRRALAFLVTLLLTVTTWSGPAQETSDIEIIEDVIYGHKSGMALIYDVFKPIQPNGTALIFLVSYGWRSPWQPADQQQEAFQQYLERGITVFNVYHGSSPQFTVPEAVSDVKRAVRHIRMNAKEYKVDDEKFVTMGYSAGGHLSLMLALDSDPGDQSAHDPVVQVSNHIAAAMAIFPPVDLTDFVGPSIEYPALNFDPALAENVSPISFVSEDDPPVLLVHGDQDRVVDISHSKRIHNELKQAGVPVHFKVIRGAGHNFLRADHNKQQQSAIFKFLEEHQFLED